MKSVLLLALAALAVTAMPAAHADVGPPDCFPIVEDCPYMGRQYNVCDLVLVDAFCIWGP